MRCDDVVLFVLLLWFSHCISLFVVRWLNCVGLSCFATCCVVCCLLCVFASFAVLLLLVVYVFV